MEEIDMYPEPAGGWIMMCPCGATEIHGRHTTRWKAFKLRWLTESRYQMTCLECGRATERVAQNLEAGT
ncbi:hypothetical protein SAMN05216571_106153 [Onishia taeanensis]|uniref:Uncharacterized protein n=1 Tax=Onishia taeanensis TaxID=284577 RepID=A0A1G7SGD3_9GAMM|nr:hypothetical protein [Halomonas taeanensis]SDG22137.1 hypothetical protein SAMN05216571_106153 [Halomonas taeanensis]